MFKMKCENTFCIYEQMGKCLFNDVDHDICGNCTDCIYVDIPQEILEYFKSNLRNKIDRYTD